MATREVNGASWNAQEWADWFKAAYKNVLSQESGKLTVENEYWVRDALEVYGEMKDEAKALLDNELKILIGLAHPGEYKKSAAAQKRMEVSI
jgi:hypothetical protein